MQVYINEEESIIMLSDKIMQEQFIERFLICMTLGAM
jgi:hypothetical protein